MVVISRLSARIQQTRIATAINDGRCVLAQSRFQASGVVGIGKADHPNGARLPALDDLAQQESARQQPLQAVLINHRSACTQDFHCVCGNKIICFLFGSRVCFRDDHMKRQNQHRSQAKRKIRDEIGMTQRRNAGHPGRCCLRIPVMDHLHAGSNKVVGKRPSRYFPCRTKPPQPTSPQTHSALPDSA